MRIALLALALLTAGCLAPGQPDPTRYPWDQPQARLAPQASYCIMTLETGSATGIAVGERNAVHMTCKPPPAAPAKP